MCITLALVRPYTQSSWLVEPLLILDTVTMRDGLSVKGSRDELLSQLWTRLGGNRSSKKKYDEQLWLLKQVVTYRKNAWE